MRLTDVTLSAHAVERYQERFAGNLGWERARERLGRLLRRSRFESVCAGKARKYALGDMRFIVKDALLLTVYHQYRHLPPPPPEEDLILKELDLAA